MEPEPEQEEGTRRPGADQNRRARGSISEEQHLQATLGVDVGDAPQPPPRFEARVVALGNATQPGSASGGTELCRRAHDDDE